MLERLADPRFRSGFATRRHGPETPYALACRRAIGVKKAADALVARRNSGDHEIVDDKERPGRPVVLAVVSHFDVPHKLAVAPIERQQVRVIGLKKYAIAEYRRSRG